MQEHSAQVYYDPHDPRVQLPGNAILCVGLDDSRPIIIDGKTRKTDVSFAALYDLGFTYESNKVFRRFDQGPHIRRYDWVRVALGKEQAKQGDTYHVFVVPTRSCVAGCMVWACNPIPFNHKTVFASFDTELLADQTAISALRTAHPILPPAPTPPAKVKARKTKAKRATPTETTAKDASSSTGQAEEQPQVKKRRRNATQAAEGQAEGKAKKVKKGKKSKEVAVEGEVKAVEEQVGQAVPEGPVTDPKPVIEGEAKKAEDSMQAVDRATEDAVGTAGEEGADSISKETTEKAVGGIKGTALSAHTV